MLRYIVFILLYFAAFVSLDESLNEIALYVAIPVACFLSFIVGGNSLKNNNYLKLLLIMYLWIAFTSLFAYYQQTSMRDLRACLGVVLLCITISNMSLKSTNIPFLYGIYIILFVSAIQYANEYIIGAQYNIERDRVNDSKLNANTIAYYTFFLTYALFMLGDIVKQDKYKKIFRLCFLLTIVISIIVALFTASRQVLIIQVPLILLLLYLRYWKKTSKGMKIAFISIAVGVILISSAQVIETYSHSYLSQRIEVDAKDDVRLQIMKNAFEVGCNNFFFGVGPANFVHFNPTGHIAHCTYLELFADCGIIAALLFIYVLYKFEIKQWRYYRKSKNNTDLSFFIFGLIYALDNIFFVFYNGIWLMGFFVLVASHSLTYHRERLNFVKSLKW